METKSGIPFKNIITQNIVVADQRVVKLLYHESSVTIMPSGWIDTYHVIIEDGNSALNSGIQYKTMCADEIKSTFNINISEY